MPLTSLLPGFLLSYFITIQHSRSISLTLHLAVASHHMNFNARQRFFYYMASGVAGKSKDRFRVRQKQQGYPHALKPLYATVSCQLLRPRVRAMPFCEGARCAMKAQQRNTKHTQFSAWNLCGACVADRISPLFGEEKGSCRSSRPLFVPNLANAEHLISSLSNRIR